MRVTAALALALSATALALSAAPAVAILANTATGRVSYQPLNQAPAAKSTMPLRSTAPIRKPPLLYHGGPVMHSQTSYAIFWAPSGYSFPSGYKAAIEGFLKNVAADAGKSTNVYSLSAQYTDETNHATYSDAYGGSVTDTHAYPTAGTCPPYFGAEIFTACISDEKLEAQLDAVAGEQGWPTGLGAEYYVVLPPHAGSCFEEAGEKCFEVEFCAYHSYSAATGRIYADIGYSPGDPEGCGVGEHPNGHADDTLSDLSHEANESITDPLLNAWFDEEGFENGDECRGSGDDYGAPLGGSAGTLFNQSIGAGHYYLQQEWSNDIGACAQRVAPATPVIADPGELISGQPASFDAASSTPGSGAIVSYEWEFGDGATATGTSPTHTYASPGPYTVTLTLTDDGGFPYSKTRQVSVLPPPLPPAVSIAAASALGETTATLDGTVDPEGRATTYRFEYGTTTVYGKATAEVSAGSGLTGHPVSATIGPLSPGTTYHYRLLAQNSIGPAPSADRTFTTAATPPAPPQPQPPPTSTSPPTTSAPPAPPSSLATSPPSVKCRKGFQKKKVRGRVRCVKIGRHRPRQHR